MTRISFVLAVMLLTSGCGLLWGYFAGSTESGKFDTITDSLSPGGPVSDLVGLVDGLRAAGATIEPRGDIAQPFFAVTGQVIGVNGEDVQVFEYADSAAADADAAMIAPDAGSIGTNMITWMATPHVYRAGKLIVLYVGDNTAITTLLESLLGAQFAGR